MTAVRPAAVGPAPAGAARRALRVLVPGPLRRALRERLDRLVRDLKAPRMVWGYRDASGAWRPRTRISDTVLIHRRENVRLADDVFVWHYSILDGTGGLEVGEGTQIGAWVGVFTHSSHVAIRVYGSHYGEVPEHEKTVFEVAPVRIGRYVFVGAASKILPGVTIGDGAMIAPGSVVKSDVPAFSLFVGNPGRVMGSTKMLDEPFLAADPQLRAWYEEWQARTGAEAPATAPAEPAAR